MTTLQDDQHPLIDIRPPVVNSPKAGEVYRSPFYVDITRGEGGTYAAKKFKIHFYYDGPYAERDAHLGRYQMEMDPGPHELHTLAVWYSGSQNEESDWVFIKYFYVLTPPVD
ncbi:hypothetical protein [Pseudomonas sp. Pseusp3]|uniref:hypothetical protein n=1 Tax=unclassified Pseudomonas TaxID=196821 RepID=UPI0039AFAEDB